MKKHYNFKTLTQGVKSLVAFLMVTLMAAGNVFAQTQQYQLINEGQTDWSGTYLLVSAPTTGAQAGKVVALNGVSTTSTPYGLFEDVTAYMTGDVIASNTTTDAVAVTIAAGSNGYTINQAGVGYYGWSSGNSLKAAATASDNHYEWTFSVANGELTISNASDPSRHLQFNAVSPRFASYASVQTNCKLYKLGAETPVAVAAPTFTVASGTYFAAQTVTIEGPAGATIYYTVDGTTPDATSTEYTAPIAVNATTTIKAIAVLGSETSSVATATYTIRIPVEVANIAAFKAAAGTDVYKITGPVTVVGQYSNKYYTFVQDNTGSLYIYGTMANAYEPGDLISDGVYGTYDLYNGLNEMKPVSGLPTGQGVTGTPVQPVVATLADIVANYADYEAKLVTVNGVTIAADQTFGTSSATRGVNISQGDASAQIYNTMGTITGKQVYANDVVNVTGYVIRYNTTIEIVPRSHADIVSLVASLPYNVNFDSNVDDGIVLNNGTATNQWFIGQASGFDNNKLFITSNNGATNKYDNEASLVKASRTLRIPASGATLMFDYRVNGNSNDCLVVSVVKNNTETVLATFFGSNDWNSASLTIDPAFAGDVDLVFTWRNDASVDNQFPAAIDNIAVVENGCEPVSDLTATVTGTTAVISWTAPAGQNSWILEYKYADHSEWHTQVATSNSVTLAGLDGNTTYDVRVKANCGDNTSFWTSSQFTIDCQTPVQGTIDVTIGDGSSTNNYLPFYGLFNYAYSQQIYDAAELNLPAGPITEISFYCPSLPTNNDRTGDIRIWMANTTKSTFANNTDYIDPSELTEVAVVPGMHPMVSGWNTFTLDQPFMYDGTSNLVVAYYEGYAGYASMSFWAHSTTDNKSISHYSDTYSYVSYSTPATAAGSKYYNTFRNDIKLAGTGIICGDAPACAEPTNLTVSNVTNYTANLAWTPGDSTQVSWTVEYKADNDADWTAVNVASTTYNMVSLAPNTHYQVRVKANCTATSFSEYAVADFTTFSACMEPANISVVSIIGTRVELNWTPRGTETAWVVEYKPENVSLWQSINVANTPWVTLNGLQPLTTYDVRVKAVCGSESASQWVNGQFTTDCGQQSLPYEESFESFANNDDAPLCWSFINNDGYSATTYPRAYVYNSTTYAHDGAKSLYFRASNTEYLYAIMPSLRADRVTLNFWYRNAGTTASYGEITVGVMTDPNNENSFTALQVLPKTTTLTEVTLNIPNLTNSFIAFRYGGGTSTSYAASIDAINVIELADCPIPTDLVKSNVTASSVDLAWTPRGNETQWQIEYGPFGFQPGSGTTVTVSTNPYTLTGLTENVEYEAYVRAVCSATSTSDWSLPVNFTPSNCNEITFGNGTTNGYNAPFSNLYKNSWVQMVYNKNDVGGVGYITSISFNSAASASVGFTEMKLYMGTKTDAINNSTSDWVPASDLTLVYSESNGSLGGSTGWITYDLDQPFYYDGTNNLVIVASTKLPNYSSSVKFYYTAVTNAVLYRRSDATASYADHPGSNTGTRATNLPNLLFSICASVPTQSCPAPTMGNVTAVTGNSAVINWTANGTETQWEVEYGPAGFTQGTGTVVTATSNSLTLTGLSNATAYDAYVRANCGTDDNSDWSSVASFITEVCDNSITSIVGTGTSTSYRMPYDPYYNNSWSETIYPASEINGSGNISAISFQSASSTSYDVSDFKIYLATRSSSTFSGISDWTPQSDMTLVYHATNATLGGAEGWETYQLSTPYAYNGTDNLVVIIAKKADDYSRSKTYYYTETSNAYLYRYDDYDATVAEYSATEEGTTNSQRANAKFTFCPIVQLDKDLVLENVNSISDACDQSNIPVKFTVRNGNQTDAITTFTASYSINNGTAVTETFTTNLTVGSQATFTFGQLANFTAATNTLEVTVNYAGDADMTNNTASVSVNVLAPIELPYSEDFTNVVLGQNGWLIGSRNDNTVMWEVINGTPTYTYSNDYNAASYMVSPCIHIPAGQYMISYDYNALGLLPENMTVYIATSPAPADWTVIGQYQGITQTPSATRVNYLFNNSTDGVYYIVVKAGSVRGSNGVTFDNLNITSTVNVTLNAGSHGSVNPTGTVTVGSGSDFTFCITPDPGYHVASISVNGTQVQGEDQNNSSVYFYTLYNVTMNSLVDITFTPSSVIVSKYVNTNTPFGQFVPAAPETLPYGGNTTLTFNVNPHHHLSSLLLSDYAYTGNNTLANATNILANTTRTGDTYTYELNNIYHNKSVLATVRIDTVGLFYTVYGHGVIENQFVTDANSPVPAHFSRYVDYGSTFTATFVPAAGYHVQSVTINGVNYGAIEAYQFANISEQQNVEVVFAPNTYVITTNGYGPGMVSPGATFIYDPANTYYFAATPVTGYRIASVLRNNVPLTIADPEATFRDTLTNILDNYHYEVSFNPMDYNVTATCGANGQIAPMGVNTYHYNNQGVYTIMANTGYYISSVTIDGNTTNYTQADALTTYTYTFNFTGANAVDHSISATFAPYQYTVTVTTPTHGTITPGTTTYNYGQSPVFAITPAAGYGIVNVMVDGVNVGAVTSYQFPALTADHTLSATFAQYQYVITATAGNGGTISPVGATNMVSGGNQTYTITPATGYHITDVFVDGASVGAVGTYTFSNVTANHTIFAAFDVNEYTITVTQPANGAITPGTTTVTYGATPTFVVTPNTGYSVTAITLNGSNVMSQAQNTNGVYTYTLPAVSANATLTATMTRKTFTITKNAGSNGAINGPATANYGATVSYTIVPNAGYVVDNVVVDGMNMGAITSYTFVNVVANHTIAATFRLEDCVIPTNMHTTDITTTSGTFSWYHPTATSFEVQYKPILGTTFNTVTVNADNYTVTTLQPSTTYVWMVRANCGNNNYSAWSNGQSFRTKDEIPDGIEDYTAQELINVYASHSDIHIVNEYGVQIDNVEVYDVYGKQLYSGHVTSSNEVISMNVAVGTYMVRLITDKGNATYKLYLTK